MGFINTIKKGIDSLPGLRRPKTNSFYDAFMNNYGWSFTRSNKTQGDLGTYYQAYNNVYVKSCIKAFSRYSLLNGFSIKDRDNVEVDPVTVSYLENLFLDPQGKNQPETFAILNDQIWKSWKLTGDAFIEINYDENYGNIPIGFKYIPTELMMYNRETEQWGIRNSDYLFEDDQLIHIYEPRIEVHNHLWGVSEIDSIGLAIALEFQGMKHNKEIFENNGIDPRGIVSFDSNVKSTTVQQTINRIKADGNKKGLLFGKGISYQSTSNSNRDMDFLNLMTYARDRVLVGFQVPPAIIGIIETASLGSGTGEAQEKSFNKTLSGECKTIENAFNKVLGRTGFKEIFEYNHMDLENKLTRAQIEDLQVKNGVKYINEVRTDYGLEPVAWGDVPMNYGMFGTTTPSETNNILPLGVNEQKNNRPEVETLQKALYLERLNKEYSK
ncbi:MAG: phage portal protein [Methanobrevibacter sp.]|uniref:phage portal protein n=1 Tax=Methanobrevibacter sp. TaxID=66852 RepID=UPI0026DFE6B8|nr:phage portal protein [Methanobrevibacter sp.]MDO5849300.1 phage portal protein [Methanobrevibacter sp.]